VRVLGIGIAIIQLLDILIHAATNQLEILRVSSNIIILVWLAVITMGKIKANSLPMAVCAIGVYLILNVIFLAIEGVTNVEQGGGLRVALFVLVFLTVTLSSLFTYLQRKGQS
jgi:hypothetical protein